MLLYGDGATQASAVINLKFGLRLHAFKKSDLGCDFIEATDI